jgi:hypothetical protein
MKLLAYLLLVIAIGSGVVLAAVWRHQVKDSKTAAAAEKDALDNLAAWRLGNSLNDQSERIRVSNDEKRIENDNLEIEIAQLQGRSTSKARAQLSLDMDKLASARLAVGLTEDMRQLGPDKNEAKAAADAQAAHQRNAADLQGIDRDERFAYAVGALFVCSGFAFALSRKRQHDNDPNLSLSQN